MTAPASVRLRFTISGVYEVDLSDDNMVVAYGSTAPAQVAKELGLERTEEHSVARGKAERP